MKPRLEFNDTRLPKAEKKKLEEGVILVARRIWGSCTGCIITTLRSDEDRAERGERRWNKGAADGAVHADRIETILEMLLLQVQ